MTRKTRVTSSFYVFRLRQQLTEILIKEGYSEQEARQLAQEMELPAKPGNWKDDDYRSAGPKAAACLHYAEEELLEQYAV